MRKLAATSPLMGVSERLGIPKNFSERVPSGGLPAPGSKKTVAEQSPRGSQKSLFRDHLDREETKGRFRKRMVLANVPSFRFSVPREHPNVPSFRFRFCGNMPNAPSFRFSFRGNVRMYPRSGFRSGRTSTKTTLFENHPSVNRRLETVKKNFWTLFDPWAGSLHKTLSLGYLLGVPGPTGPGDSCKGRPGAQAFCMQTLSFFGFFFLSDQIALPPFKLNVAPPFHLHFALN